MHAFGEVVTVGASLLIRRAIQTASGPNEILGCCWGVWAVVSKWALMYDCSSLVECPCAAQVRSSGQSE